MTTKVTSAVIDTLTTLTVSNSLNVGTSGSISVTNTTDSTSTTSGAVQISGGVGIGGRIVSTGLHTSTGYTTKPSTSYDVTGSYLHAGTGVNIGQSSGGNLFFGDGFTPSVIKGAPTYVRSYVQNDLAAKQLWYGNSTGLLVGNGEDPAQKLDVRGSAIISGSAQVSTSLGVGVAGSGVAGEIRATGEITAFSASDRRLKTNIRNIENALDKIDQINGVMFDWTDDVIQQRGGEDGYFVRKSDTGVIAQEVEAVLPEVIGNRVDGHLAVSYEKMIGLLIEGIKELRQEVKAIKQHVGLK